MISVVDYDAGNIKSVVKALEYLGAECKVTRDRAVLMNSDGMILPGVGNFGDAMNKIRSYGLEEVIKAYCESGRPFLGICLGMQVMFEESEEAPGVRGLSLLKGKIHRIPALPGIKVPHIGWNSLEIADDVRLLKDVRQDSFVYFVHSFYLKADDSAVVKARTDYGVKIDASVEHNNISGCQFHPEKSSSTGLQIFKNFMDMSREVR